MFEKKLKDKIQNPFVISTLIMLCRIFLNNNKASAKIQLIGINKIICILVMFNNFNQNQAELITIKNDLINRMTSSNLTSNKWIFNAIAAINTMINIYKNDNQAALDFNKGIEVALKFLLKRKFFIEKRSLENINHAYAERMETISTISKHMIDSSDRTNTTRKRNLDIFLQSQVNTSHFKRPAAKKAKFEETENTAESYEEKSPKIPKPT